MKKYILFKIIRKIYFFLFYKYEYLYYRFFYSKRKLSVNKKSINKRYLLAGVINLDKIAHDYKKLFPHKIQPKIEEADLICNHIFDLLGSGPRQLSPEGKGYQSIDWPSDFKSGYTWNQKTFYRNIQYGRIEGVDIKVPWELSRFHHLNILGQAYILTKNKKYVEEFINQIRDWIKNNTVGFGVNWKCTMDVAIRASTWLVAQEYFSEEGLISDDFWQKFYTSIYEHGKFIRNHLENKGKITNNHYIADLVGLFFIAVYCSFYKESKEWQDFAIKELTREITKQVYPDGCDFEASTSYHRLVLEMLFYTELLAQRADINLPDEYKNRVRKMFEFSLYCIKPNGRIPQIGDNDNGRFLIFSKRSILEHKYLLSFAAIYYRESMFNVLGFDLDEEAYWVFGLEGKEIFYNVPLRKDPVESKAFPDSGRYIMHKGNDYCFISCGPNGQNGNGGHAHNDKLSFELMLNGHDIIVDPGTYVYTAYPEERNKFRSTGYHNTIKFDGYEQNEISEKDLFSLPGEVKIKKANLKEIDNNIVFQGETQYAGITHKRKITLYSESGSWHIKDIISSPKQLKGKLLFHLSPSLTCEGNEIIVKETKEKIAAIEIMESKIEEDGYDYSPEYGRKVKANCLGANISDSANIREINTYIRKIK